LSGLFAIIALSIFSMHFEWTIRYSFVGTEPFATSWEKISMRSQMDSFYQWSYGVGWGGVVWTGLGLLVAVIHKLVSRNNELSSSPDRIKLR